MLITLLLERTTCSPHAKQQRAHHLSSFPGPWSPGFELQQEARPPVSEQGWGTVPASCSGTPQLIPVTRKGTLGLTNTQPLSTQANKAACPASKAGPGLEEGCGLQAFNKNIFRASLCVEVPLNLFNFCLYHPYHTALCRMSLPFPKAPFPPASSLKQLAFIERLPYGRLLLCQGQGCEHMLPLLQCMFQSMHQCSHSSAHIPVLMLQ